MIDGLSRVLVLAPHTDDGEFGCGGAMARLVESGADVRQIAFSVASRSLPEGFAPDTLVHESRAAADALGLAADALTVHDFEVRTFPEVRQQILELLIDVQRKFAPQAVLMPTIGDIHQDHHTIAAEGLRAFKRTTILGYEIPWNQFSFAKQAYVVLEERQLEAKVRALECYRSQQHRNYANEEYIRNLARTHGIEIGRPFAECFEVVRWVV
jgi:LmbE family N-acetylglucosaminyl deacetylase